MKSFPTVSSLSRAHPHFHPMYNSIFERDVYLSQRKSYRLSISEIILRFPFTRFTDFVDHDGRHELFIDNYSR